MAKAILMKRGKSLKDKQVNGTLFRNVYKKKELGAKKFEKVPTGALGVYTYIERLAQGLKQLMTGNRKFALKHITRDDIASLTKDAANISGIPYVMDVDKKEVEKILNS